MGQHHQYTITTRWTGNLGTGTNSYTAYSRDHVIAIPGKADINGSSDPSYRGDPTRHNPEEMLVSSIAACHMLWYLHFCSAEGVVVTAYIDHAKGIMQVSSDGSGYFSEVTLYPEVTVTDASMVERANELHKRANQFCFIANSCNFPIKHEPVCKIAKETV